MNRILITGLFLIVAIGFSTCKHEVIELPPQGSPFVPPPDTTDTANFKPCDPDTIYFDRDVLPILKSNCAKSGCHLTSTGGNKIGLASYEAVMYGEKTIVKPFDLNGSDLYEAINQTDSTKDNFMPQPDTANRLTPAEISIIQKWIMQGAKQLFCDECDTLVSYSESVAPILFTSCKGCHYENSNYPNVPALWFIKAKPTSSTDVIHAKLKSIGANRIKAALDGTIPPPSKLTVMPPSGKMDTCSISIVEDWINDGMPE